MCVRAGLEVELLDWTGDSFLGRGGTRKKKKRRERQGEAMERGGV